MSDSNKVIDENIVSLEFDNKSFEKHVNKSLGTVNKLKKSLTFEKSSKELNKLSSSINKMDFSKLDASLDSIKNKMSVWGVASKRIIENFVDSSMRTIKGLYTKISTGGLTRALNMEAAKFQFAGLGMDIEKSMDAASNAVKGTAYSLDSAAKVASQLGASGVKAGKDMEQYLKGIAGMAAMTGSSYDEIGHIFTTVAGNGRLMSEQLMQFSFRGINAAAELAKQMGVTEAQVRQMVSKGQISFDTFAKAMDKAFGEHAKEANKTFSGAMSNMNAALSRIGASFKSPQLEYTRDIINDLTNVIDYFHESLNPVIKDFTTWMHDGRSLAMMLLEDKDTLKIISNYVNIARNSFHLFLSVLKPVAKAFLDVFPPTPLKILVETTKKFSDFIKNIKLTDEQSEKLRNTFRGLFAIFSIFKTILSTIASIMLNIFSTFIDPFLTLTSSLGNFIVELDYYIKVISVVILYTLEYFDVLNKIKSGMTIGFSVIFSILKDLGGLISYINPDIKSISDLIAFFINTTYNGISYLTKFFNSFSNSEKKISNTSKKIGIINYALKNFNYALKFLPNILSVVGDALKFIGDIITYVTSRMSFTQGVLWSFIAYITLLSSASMKIIFSFAGIIKSIEKLIISFSTLTKGIGKFFSSVNEIAKAQKRKGLAAIILSLAAALGVLTLSIYLISTIDTNNLIKAGIAVGSLIAVMGLFSFVMVQLSEKLKENKSAKELVGISLLMISLSYSVAILTSALRKLDDINTDGILIKVASVGLIIATLVGATLLLNNFSSTSDAMLGLLSLTWSLSSVISSLEDLADLDPNKILKSIPTIIVLITSLLFLSKIIGKVKFSSGAGFLLTAIALNSTIPIVREILSHIMKIDVVKAIKSLRGYEHLVIIFGLVAAGILFAASNLKSDSNTTSLSFLAFSLSILAFLKLVKLMDKIKVSSILKAIAYVGSITILFKLVQNINENTEKAHPLKMAITFSLMAIAIGTLFGITYIIGKADPKIVFKGLGFVLALSAILVAIYKIIDKADGIETPKLIQLGIILSSILLLGLEASKLGNLSVSTLFKGLSSITVLALIITMINSLNSSSNELNFNKNLITAVSSILLLGLEASKLGNLSVSTLFKGLSSITILALIITMINSLNSNIDSNESNFNKNLIIAVSSILLLGLEVSKLGNLSVSTLFKGLSSIAILSLIITMINSLNSNIDSNELNSKSFTQFGMIIISIGAITGSLFVLSKFNWEKLLSSAASIALVLLSYSFAFSLISDNNYDKKSLKRMVTFLLGIVALNDIALAIEKLADEDWVSLMGSAAAIALVLTSYANVFISINNMNTSNDIISKIALFLTSCFIFSKVVEVLTLLASYDWASLIASAAAIALVITSYANVFMAINNMELGEDLLTKIATFILGTASILSISASLTLLASYDWASLIGSAAAIALVITSYANVFMSINNMELGEDLLTKIATFALGTASILSISASLTLLASYDWQSILASGASIFLVLYEYSKVFTALSTTNVDLATIAIFALGTLALIPIAVAISLLAGYDWQNMIGAAASICLALLGYSLVFKIMSTINPGAAVQGAIAIVAAFAALAVAFVAVIAIVGTVMVAIGALDELLDGAISSFGEKGAEVLRIIGEGIGAFFGGIVDGFVSAATNSLPDLGTKMSEFMTNAKPFFDGLKSIPGDAVRTIGILTAVIVALSAVSFIEGVKSLIPFFNKTTGIDALGEKLAILGKGLTKFSDSIEGLDEETIKKAEMAGRALAVLVDAMPNTGGVLQFFTGEADIQGFADSLPNLGEKIMEFSTKVADLDPAIVEKGTVAGKMLASLIDALPNSGGVAQFFTGEADITSFADDLPNLGEKIMEFSLTVADLNEADVNKGAAAGLILAKLVDALPNSGGVAQFFTGESDVTSFANDLPHLGEKIMEFSLTVADLNEANVTKGAFAGQILANLLNSLPNSGGIGQFFTGDKSLKKFGEDLPDFGTNVKAFADNVAGLNVGAATMGATIGTMLADLVNKLPNSGGLLDFFTGDASLGKFGSELPGFGNDVKEFASNISGVKGLGKVSTIVQSLSDILKTVPQKDSEVDNFSNYGKAIKKLGSNFKSFSDSVSGVVDTTITNFGTQINNLIEITNTLQGADFSKLSEFGEQIKSISDIGVKDIKTITSEGMNAAISVLKEKVPLFKNEGSNAIKELIAGFESKRPDLNSKLKSINSDIKNNIANISNLDESGKNIIRGLINGLKDKSLLEELKTSGKNIAKSVKKGVEVTLKIKSPSRVMEEDGNYTVAGFLNGVTNKLPEVYKSASLMANGFTDTIRNDLDIHSPSGILKMIGKFTGDGFIKGIMEKINQVKKIGSLTGDGFIKGLKDKLKQFDLSKDLKNEFKKSTKSTKGLGDSLNKNLLNSVKSTNATKKSKSNGKKLAKATKDGYEAQLKSTDFTNAILGYLGIFSTQISKSKKLFDSAFLKNASLKMGEVTKKYYKVTSEYVMSGSNNKFMQSAISFMGDSLVKTINANIRERVKESGNNSKANRKKIAKEETNKAIKELKYEKKVYNKSINDFGKTTKNNLSKIPQAFGAFAKDYKPSIQMAKGTVESFSKYFGSSMDSSGKSIDSTILNMYKQTDAYKENMSNIKKYSKDYKENMKKASKLMAKVDWAQYEKDSAIQKSKKATKKQKKEAKKRMKTQEKYITKLNNYVEKGSQSLGKLTEASKKSAKDQEKVFKDLENKINETIASYLKLSNFKFDSSNLLNGLTKFSKSTNLILDNTLNGIDSFINNVASSSSQARQAFSILNASFDTGIDTFNMFSKTGKADSKALVENLDSQLDAWDEFQKGLEDLERKGFSDAVIEELESQGPQALNYIRGLLDMGESEVEVYNSKIKKKEDYEYKQLERSLNKQLKLYEKFYNNIKKLREMGLGSDILNEIGYDISNSSIASVLTRISDVSSFNSLYTKLVEESVKDIGDYVSGIATSSSKKFIDNLEKGITGEKDYSDLVKKVKSLGFDSRLIDYLKEMGSESGTSFANELLKYSTEDVDRVNKALIKKYGKIKTPMEILTENITSRLSGYFGYTSYMKIVKKTIGENSELYKYISNMGYEEGYEYAKAFAEATPDQLKKLSEEYKQFEEVNAKNRRESFLKQVVEQKKNVREYSNRLAELVKAGVPYSVMEDLKELTDENVDFVANLYSALKEEPEMFNNIVSELASLPSATKNATSDVTAIIMKANENPTTFKPVKTSGIKDEIDQLYDAFDSMATKAIQSGTDLAEGVVEGLNENSNGVIEAGKLTARRAIDSFNAEAGIHSPSTEFIDSAKNMILGLCEGLNNNSYLFINTLENECIRYTNITNEYMNKIRDIILSKLHMEPVIKPILDLSDLEKKARLINGMFYSRSNKFNEDGTFSHSKTQSIMEFNQYNYSPKALDRKEIYRQTRNQFSQLRGYVK